MKCQKCGSEVVISRQQPREQARVICGACGFTEYLWEIGRRNAKRAKRK